LIPIMMPYIAFMLVTGSIFAFQLLEPIFMLTYGGPDWRTSSYAFYLAKQAKTWYNYGYASALAVVLIAIILSLSLIELKFVQKQVRL